jgi:hypothetical protein
MIAPLLVFWMKFPIPADVIIAIDLIASVLFAWRVHEPVEKPILNKLARRSKEPQFNTDETLPSAEKSQ